MAGITRKQFSAALMGGGVMVWLTGCGGDYDPREELDGNVRISSNHGHELFIPQEDVDAGLGKLYDIRGDADDHTHTVFFNAEHFRRIKEGQVVSVGSEPADNGDGHLHSVTANPAL
jgi:hypothetical protein